ncbi:MAG: hypothetical protein RL477_2240 [Pseudomonadota bacterium]|jgi:tripartite-type tricarboxylate transporter receptor subunit TctC
MPFKFAITPALAALALVAVPASARADAISDFYKGKTINLVISTGVGGGLDLNARVVARHWTRHIPGNPTFVPRNMPGAGSLRATSYLYNQAAKDGTAVGTMIPSFVLNQRLGGKGVDYDSSKFHWIGSSNISNSTLYIWHSHGIKTLADATKKEVIMGATGAGSYTVLYPVILNNLLGTRFRVIMGYRSATQVNLAMERGEVQGRAGNNFNSLMARDAQWVKDKKLDILLQIGTRKDPDFANVPLLTEFAKDQASREVLQLFSDEVELGRPFLTTPGVPADRVAALRTSFDATMKDKQLLDEAKKSGLDISPTSGAELQRIAGGIVNASDDLVNRVKAALDLKNTVAGEVKSKGDKKKKTSEE